MLLRQELLGKGPLQSRGGTTGSVGFHIKYKLQPDCLVFTKKRVSNTVTITGIFSAMQNHLIEALFPIVITMNE